MPSKLSTHPSIGDISPQFMIADEKLTRNQRKLSSGIRGPQETARQRSKDLTLAQQLVAYGQHLHERPQLLVFGEQLGQVLTAQETKQTNESSVSKLSQYHQSIEPNKKRGANKQSWHQQSLNKTGKKSMRRSTYQHPDCF